MGSLESNLQDGYVMVWKFVSFQDLSVGRLTPQSDDISKWGLWEMLKSWGCNTHDWNQNLVIASSSTGERIEQALAMDQEEGVLIPSKLSWHAYLGLSASGIVTNKCLFFICHSVRAVLLQQPE